MMKLKSPYLKSDTSLCHAGSSERVMEAGAEVSQERVCWCVMPILENFALGTSSPIGPPLLLQSFSIRLLLSEFSVSV